MHGGDQTNQSKEMISMQVADKYVADFLKMDVHFPQGNLGTFPAIEQKEVFIVVHQLGSRIPFRGRNGWTASKNSYIEFEHDAISGYKDQ